MPRRLLKQFKDAPGTANDEVTFYYWLGLNRIAEETVTGGGAVTATFRPDLEAGATPASNGWYKLDPLDIMAYVTDAQRGKALSVERKGTGVLSGIFINGDTPDDTDNLSDVSFNVQANRVSFYIIELRIL